MSTNNLEQKKTPVDMFESIPTVVAELHKIAKHYMHKENAVHTLQATALVNEAYLSLQGTDIEVNDRVHFFALSASHMRRILVDHARAKSTNKRQAQAMAVTVSDNDMFSSEDASSITLLDEVLSQFSDLDERAAKMYEMRLFTGLSNEEIAQVFEVSITTVERDIKVAKAWIHKNLHNS